MGSTRIVLWYIPSNPKLNWLTVKLAHSYLDNRVSADHPAKGIYLTALLTMCFQYVHQDRENVRQGIHETALIKL